MKNKACVITIAFILAITSAACEPSEKPAESLTPEPTVQTTTTASQAITTPPAQTTAPTTTTSPSTSQTIESTEATIITQEKSAETQTLTPDNDYIFTNEYGDVVDIREATVIMNGRDKIKPEQIVKEKHAIIVFEEFTYLTKPSGISYNSVDDPYDAEKDAFDVKVPEHNYEFFKVNVGDKFGPLTVEEAFIDYDCWQGQKTRGDLMVKFSGSVTVTGYASVIVSEERQEYKDRIVLLVDAKTFIDIPILLNDNEFNDISEVTYSDRAGEFYYTSDIHPIWLGDIGDYNEVSNILPADGLYYRVQMIISDLEIWDRSRSDGGRYNAKIESISLLDE